MPDTGWLKAVRVLRIAGVYWRGDARNEQLQRVYGTAWFTGDELDAYMHRLEEARKRDHRKPRSRARPLLVPGRDRLGACPSSIPTAGSCAS